jgi:hypothetical protein
MVLLLPINIVFVDIQEGNDFGYIDIFNLSQNLKKTILEVL